MFGMTFEQYRAFILADDTYLPENSGLVTGVPTKRIRRTAELLARPSSYGNRPCTSLMLEKDNYWGHN